MSFVPRTFTAILTDMIAYVQEHTVVDDFTVGSVIRTLLEAAALEDDEQYFQMVQLLDMFSYTTAAGDQLDRRLADFNIFRETAKPAFGKVLFTNGNLIGDLAAVDTLAGSTSLQVFDSTGFPTTGPYTIRVAERTNRIQDVQVSSLDTPTNTFTVAALVNDVLLGDRVSLVTGASSYPIGPPLGVQAPSTNIEGSKLYQTTETATILAGNYYSNEVTAVSTTSGTAGNTGAGRITQFTGSPPFSGVGVTNLSAFEGGVSREKDEEFRARAVEKLQSLSRGTVLALKSSSVGVTDPLTGQRVISSNVLEDFSTHPEEVIVYIDDGTGLVPDTVSLAQNTTVGVVNDGDTSIVLTDASSFPSFGSVLVGESDVVGYTSISGNTLILSAPVAVPVALDPLPASTIVRRVDVVSLGTEEGQTRFSLQNPPIIRNSARIWFNDPGSETWEALTSTGDEESTQYVLNKGTGEFVIRGPLSFAEGTKIVAHYSYYTNLVAETQKVLEGSPTDSVTYPGVKAAGVFLTVEAPVFKRITVRAVISAEVGFVESDLTPNVKQEIETYINSLKIGEDVIRSRIIDVAHNVVGVRSVIVQLPTTDITVLENELPVAFDTNKNSLVTVL